MPEITIARRTALKLLAGASLLPIVGRPALADTAPGIDFIVIADLHSAYDHIGQLLAAIENHVATASRPCVVLFNGDLFEVGNAVAKRSNGSIDWAFLGALADIAPTVFNLGNHEPDLDPDLAHFVTRAGDLGITVLTNIVDARTGAGYAPASASLEVGGQRVTIAACATDNMFTYPKPTRPQLSIPKPAEWAAANLPSLLGTGGINVLLSHAGVVADKAILPLLADGTLFVGGHDHLNLVHAEGNTRYLHTGSWSDALTVASVAGPGAAAEIRRIDIDPAAPASDRLAGLIADVLAEHLTKDDLAPVGHTDAARSTDEAGLFAAASLAIAVGADAGFIGHTTFGAGLPAGPVSRYAFDACVRFEGKLMTVEVDAATLAAILARCNQFGDFPFAARTGDYLYAAKPNGDKAHYRLVCNDWAATNQRAYFGRDDLAFTEVPDRTVKATVIAALS